MTLYANENSEVLEGGSVFWVFAPLSSLLIGGSGSGDYRSVGRNWGGYPILSWARKAHNARIGLFVNLAIAGTLIHLSMLHYSS